jgi:hypothetical protein
VNVSYIDGLSPPRGLEDGGLAISESILSIQDEVKKAKEEAKMAKQKQLEREENLRDVILQYKMLQKENEQLTRSLQQQEYKEENNSVDSENLYAELANEHDTLQASIHSMQGKLDTVHKSLRNAQENPCSRRDAIEQYKNVQDEFLSAFQNKKDLETVLYNKHVDSTGDTSHGENMMSMAELSEAPREVTVSMVEVYSEAPREDIVSMADVHSEASTGREDIKYATHRGNTTIRKLEEPRLGGTVRQRILMLESAYSKHPLPPSNLSSPNNSSGGNDQHNEVSPNGSGKSKRNKNGKKLGFLRGNRMGFASKLSTLSSKAIGNEENT